MSSQREVPDSHLYIGDTLVTDTSGGVYQHVYSPTGEPQAEIPFADLARSRWQSMQRRRRSSRGGDGHLPNVGMRYFVLPS